MNTEIFAITLVTSDLAATERFYETVFGAKTVHSDEVSRVFKFGSVLINCLERSDAEGLFAPARVADVGAHASIRSTLGTKPPALDLEVSSR